MRLLGHHQVDKHTHYESPRRRGKGRKPTWRKIVAENFPNLVKDMDIQIQEIQRTLSIIYPKMFT